MRIAWSTYTQSWNGVRVGITLLRRSVLFAQRVLGHELQSWTIYSTQQSAKLLEPRFHLKLAFHISERSQRDSSNCTRYVSVETENPAWVVFSVELGIFPTWAIFGIGVTRYVRHFLNACHAKLLISFQSNYQKSES